MCKNYNWLSIASVVVSICTLLYTLYLNERGPFFRKPELQFSVSSKVEIENTFFGIKLSPYIEISNTGKVSGKIERMEVFIVLSPYSPTSRKILPARTYSQQSDVSTIGSFQISPGYIWRAKVYFAEDFTEATYDAMIDLDFSIASFLQKQGLKLENKNKEIAISKDLYARLRAHMTEKTKWLEAGEYKLLLTIFGGDNDKEVIFQKGYKFRISSEVLKGLKEYQLDSYMYPPKVYNNNNIFMNYVARPSLTELPKEDLASLIFEYRKY